MILFFKPQFIEKIWGGTALRDQFDYAIPSDKTGECWGISAMATHPSVILNGPFKGQTLNDVWNDHPELFGHPRPGDFPILIKLIDANDDLSIQVHPDDAHANKLGSYGKSECWLILDAAEDSDIIIGHHAKDKKTFMDYVNRSDFLALVNKFPVKKGDFFYIEAGTLHAILRHTLLLEVQQSSDITYRFYDYDRLENGKKRPLHLKEALSVVKIPDKDVKRTHKPDFFTFETHTVNGQVHHEAHQKGDFLIVLAGAGMIDDSPLKKGDFLFVSSGCAYSVEGDLECVKVSIV